MKRWHLAKSEPSKVAWLIASLANLGVEVFYPEITVERRGRKKREALFPNYVFCRFDASAADWNAMQWAPGLNCFLGFAERPLQLSDDLVEDIRRRMEEANKRVSKAPGFSSDLQAGESNSDFIKLDAIFNNSLGPKQRVKMLLRVIGRTRPLNVSKTEPNAFLPRL